MWDLETEKCLDVFLSHSNWIECIDISVCGNFFVTGTENDVINIWNRKGVVKKVETDSQITSTVLCGNTLVTGHYNNTVKVWRFE